MKNNLKLFLTFLKIGATTFGGGYAMISIIKDEIVDKNEWLTNDEMLEIVSIAQTTPGPIAINMATFVGYKRGKVLGSILATLGVVIPSIIIILLISLIFNLILNNKYVLYAFLGIKACVSFLILKAGIEMLSKMKKEVLPIILLIITILTLIIFNIFSINFSSILLIIIAGVIGLTYYSIESLIKEKRINK